MNRRMLSRYWRALQEQVLQHRIHESILHVLALQGVEYYFSWVRSWVKATIILIPKPESLLDAVLPAINNYSLCQSSQTKV